MFDVEKILQFVYKYSLVIYTSLVFLIILLRSIPGSKRARITRYFRRNSDIRFQLIKNLDKQPDVVLGDFSSLEIVAALTIISSRKSVSETFSVAQRLSTMGWREKFNDEFFTQLDQTARSFSAKFWRQDSAKLFRLGYMIAKANQEYDWAEQFEESFKGVSDQRVRKDLPTRMK